MVLGEIRVRNVTKTDLHLLVEFYNRYEPGSITSPPVELEGAEPFFFGAPNFKPEGCFLAFVGTELVGVAFAEWDPDVALPSGAKRGDVWWLRVKEGWQRQGIGSLLLSKATSFLKAEGMSEIVTWVAQKNPADLAFYSKHGFRILEDIYGLERSLKDVVEPLPLPDDYVVQPFEISLLNDWVAVYNRAFKGAPDLPQWGNRELSVDEYRAWMLDDESGHHCYEGIKHDTQLVAICEVMVDPKSVERNGRKLGHIRTIAVNDEHRRKGLAKALVTRGMLWLRQHGTEIVTATVWSSNTASLSLFRRMGFSVAKTTHVMLKRL